MKTNKQQSPESPSIPAEAGTHESRPSYIVQLPLPQGVASQRPLAKKGNPTLQVPPLYYNPDEQTGWVYIIANKPNGVLYVGQTTNLPRRITEHKQGKIEGFSKQYGCNLLVYFEGFSRITESIEKETAMKNWTRAWKLRRILQTNPG